MRIFSRAKTQELVILLFIMVFALSSVSSSKYSGGTGEPNTPYLIATPNDLNSIGLDSNDWDKHFKMIADVNMAGYSYSTAVIAADINNSLSGFQGTPFTGVFEGNCHRILNLIIDTNIPHRSYFGLFGYVNNGYVLNLGVENISITLGDSSGTVGSLAGRNQGGIISNCYSKGSISGSGWGFGGLVGSNISNSTIRNCYSSCTVEAIEEYSRMFGGLVGYCEDSNVVNCFSTGNVIGGESDLGGLVGYNVNSNISNCYSESNVSGCSHSHEVGGLVGTNFFGSISSSNSTGNIYGRDNVGGLVGDNAYSNISSCFSTSKVEAIDGGMVIGGLVGNNERSIINISYSLGGIGSANDISYVGGLVGWNYKSNIHDCYSNSNIASGTEYIGGLAGYNSESSIANSYASGSVLGYSDVGSFVGYSDNGSYVACLSDKNTNPDVNEIGNLNDPNVIGLLTDEMQQRSTFADAGWDMVEVWDIGENQTYPFLRTHLPSDINKDDKTDFYDLAILAENWLSQY